MHIMCFDRIQPLALLQFLSLPTLPSPALLFKPLSRLSERGSGRSTGAWPGSMDHIPEEKSLSPNSHPLPLSPQLGMDLHGPPPRPCWDYGWPGHVQALCT